MCETVTVAVAVDGDGKVEVLGRGSFKDQFICVFCFPLSTRMSLLVVF